MNQDKESVEGIAVIGFAGRFPKAKNVDQFWQNLRSGVEAISTYSDDELTAQGIPAEIINDPNYVKAEFFLEDVDRFDAAFFGVNPAEANIMDPQHRIFLETAWESLENAGYDPDNFKGLIGVFGGASLNDYLFNLYSQKIGREPVSSYQRMIGNDKDYLCTRISYKLNLKGPSFTVQTACSTSLVALHMACQSLLNYECDMALSGGVCVNLPQKRGYLYKEGLIFSPDGHCRAFDKSARGTVAGQGAGVVVLKRFAEAIEDGDTIHAIIKGSAINNDGANKAGYTAPSVDGQAEVIINAQALAEVDPGSISYIETHGTGTLLGDPVEIAGLTQAFRAGTQKKRFCAIGSVKTNIGHLDVAAGVAGFIKTVLALKHREIPPSLHFKNPNPKIDFENSPFYVNQKLSKWSGNGTPRRAGVSSFGIGGTNAHVVIEEAPESESSGPSRPKKLLLISAKTKSALDLATANLHNYLKTHLDTDIADVAYTLKIGRKSFNHRRFLVCSDVQDAIQTLESLNPTRVINRHHESGNPEVVFMFPGQGSHYVNMGLNFYEDEPLFRHTLDRCAEILEPVIGQDIRLILYPGDGGKVKAEELLRETCFQQPVIFTIEYALAKLWEKWGVQPKAMIGHSIGEYVAACFAGIFSLKDALFLISTRGRMMQDRPRGTMLSIRLPVEEVEPRLHSELSVAAINAPSLCVVSGSYKEVEKLRSELENTGISCSLLHTSHAFHSPMMDSIVEPFAEYVSTLQLSKPSIPIVSTVTGTWMTTEQATDPMYWARQLRATVRFAEGVETLWKRSDYILLEVGPRVTCSSLARQQVKDASKQTIVASLANTAAEEAEWTMILTAIGQLLLAGISINWESFYEHEKRRRVPLPTYPFERKRFWIAAANDTPGTGVEGDFVEKTTETDKLEPQGDATISHHQVNDERHDAPTTSAEDLVATTWREVLCVDCVGVKDNFINLGGDSLSAIQVVEIIKKKTGIQLYPTLISSHTLGQIATHLKLEQSSTALKSGNEEKVKQTCMTPNGEDDHIGEVSERLKTCLNKIRTARKECLNNSMLNSTIEKYRTFLTNYPVIPNDHILGIEKNIDDQYGINVRILCNKALVYQLYLENIREIDNRGLPSKIVIYLREDFIHVLNLANKGDKEILTFSNFQFLSYIKKLSLKSFPVGVQNIEISGIQRSLMFKQSFSNSIGFVKHILLMGGNYPLYEFHLNPHRYELFSPKGIDEALRLTAQMVANTRDIKGVFGATWAYDPELKKISPELSYIREMIEEIGGVFFLSSSSEEDRRNAFAFSKARKVAYEEGRYTPTSYLMIIARDKLLKYYM